MSSYVRSVSPVRAVWWPTTSGAGRPGRPSGQGRTGPCLSAELRLLLAVGVGGADEAAAPLADVLDELRRAQHLELRAHITQRLCRPVERRRGHPEQAAVLVDFFDRPP